LAAIEPAERGLATEIRIGVDEPIGDDRPRHIVAKQQCDDLGDVFSYVVMVELKRRINLFGQPGTDAEDVVATEQTFVGTAQIIGCFQPRPERSDEDYLRVCFCHGGVATHDRPLLGV